LPASIQLRAVIVNNQAWEGAMMKKTHSRTLHFRTGDHWKVLLVAFGKTALIVIRAAAAARAQRVWQTA